LYGQQYIHFELLFLGKFRYGLRRRYFSYR